MAILFSCKIGFSFTATKNYNNDNNYNNNNCILSFLPNCFCENLFLIS